MGKKFWLRALLYYGVLINTLNMMNRKKDMEENPKYYQDDEYGFWDYTMFGNTIGSQTRLFTGRDIHGTEEYLRWGKQFRELPELLYDDTGFNFPQAALKKLGGKASPMVNIISQIFFSKSPSGFKNYDLEDKKGLDWFVGVTKTLMKTPLPFSTQAALRKDKEWKAYNLFVPSGAGMTRRKASDLFEIALSRNDDEMARQVLIGAYRNGIDGETMNRMVSDYHSEELRYIKEAKEFEAKSKEAKTAADKAYYLKRAAIKRTESVKISNSSGMIKVALAKLKVAKIKHPNIFGKD